MYYDTASKLVDRARSLADLTNSKFISYQDELSSVNEAYRDIYNWMTNNDDDYFIKTVVLTAADFTQDPTDPGTILLTLPADYYKTRYIDYRMGTMWTRMHRYSPEGRNDKGVPLYRPFGDTIRIISFNAIPEIKLTYYPPAPVITLPEYALLYGTSYPVYSRDLITSPFFISSANSLLYIYNGTTIKVESVDYNTVNTPITLYTSTGLSNCVYYKGYIYFLKDGEIYRATTTLDLPAITPVVITSSGGLITNFNVLNGQIYYSTSTEIRTCKVDGSSDALELSNPGSDLCWYNSSLAYLNGSNQIVASGFPAGTVANDLASDGSLLFYRSGSTLYMYDTAIRTVREGVDSLGYYSSLRLPIYDASDNTVKAISSIPDWVFEYPLNEVNEMIAYSCAIDFKRKQNADYAQLSERLNSLQLRFLDVIRRDDGLPQAMGNSYLYTDSRW